MNKPENPWGLTPGEAKAMDAMCDHSSAKAAARVLGIAPSTVEELLYTAGRKFNLGPQHNRLRKYLLWDRFRQSQKDATQ
jgi:DNA-binding CsgD family transcriptional regulator